MIGRWLRRRVRCDDCGAPMETREDDAGFPVAECDCGSRLQVDELEERGVVQI